MVVPPGGGMLVPPGGGDIFPPGGGIWAVATGRYSTHMTAATALESSRFFILIPVSLFGKAIEVLLKIPLLADENNDAAQQNCFISKRRPEATVGMYPRIGVSIQGPTVVKVPAWLKNPLGK